MSARARSQARYLVGASPSKAVRDELKSTCDELGFAYTSKDSTANIQKKLSRWLGAAAGARASTPLHAGHRGTHVQPALLAERDGEARGAEARDAVGRPERALLPRRERAAAAEERTAREDENSAHRRVVAPDGDGALGG